MRIPASIACPNCACALTGRRCDVCGWVSPRRAVYHIGRERMRVQNLDPYDHGFTASGHQNRADVEAAWARAIAHRLSNAIV